MTQPRTKPKAIWIEIVLLAAGMACALALLLAGLGAVAAVAAEPLPQHTYEGMITCSRCGARHSAAFGKTAADCSRACVYGGSQFALVEGEKTYLLDGDLKIIKNAAGQRARIVGVARGNTITVSSIASAT
jgi:hypothetical protein